MEGVRSPAVVLGEVPVTVASWLGKYEWMVRVVGNEDLHADVLNITVIDDASGMEGELQSVIDDLDLEEHEMLISDGLGLIVPAAIGLLVEIGLYHDRSVFEFLPTGCFLKQFLHRHLLYGVRDITCSDLGE